VESYIKLVLTIITVCLSFLTLKGLAVIPDAFAQSDITKVTICGPDGRHCGDDWIQLVQQYGRDPSWKPYILIAWLNAGTVTSPMVTSVTQEFSSQAACRTAGDRMKKGRRLGSASRDYDRSWKYICTPKAE